MKNTLIKIIAVSALIVLALIGFLGCSIISDLKEAEAQKTAAEQQARELKAQARQEALLKEIGEEKNEDLLKKQEQIKPYFLLERYEEQLKEARIYAKTVSPKFKEVSERGIERLEQKIEDWHSEFD